ncbi:MAG: TolC family protein, partial [Myxococcota bacterium]
MLVLWTLIISQNVTDSATPTCAVAIGDEADPGSGVLATICDDNGLDVLAALQRAQEVSPLSRDAALAVEQFRSDRRAARAAMLPRIQLTAGYTRISDVENPPLFPPQSAETQGANAADIGQLSDPAAQRLWNRDIEQASAESSASFPVIQDNWTIEQSLDWSLLDFVLSNRKRYRAAGLRLNARE